jgi:hypothetical protein
LVLPIFRQSAFSNNAFFIFVFPKKAKLSTFIPHVFYTFSSLAPQRKNAVSGFIGKGSFFA